MEEPVCEPPAIALYYVTRLARNHVKVLLSGEGGDEAFGGYSNYRNLLLLEFFKRGGQCFNCSLAWLLRALKGNQSLKRYTQYAPFLESSLKEYYLSRTASTFSFFYQNKEQLYTDEFRKHINHENPQDVIQELFHKVQNEHLLNQMLYIDSKTWLPDDLLIKADKISMANSLELRVPFLDHKVMEFAASLPPNFKVKGATTKRILKKAFSKSIPAEIVRRKKTGFPVPYEKWLQNELKVYCLDVLHNDHSLHSQLFERKLFEDPASLRVMGYQSKDLFSLLVLELWYNKFIKNY